MVTKDTTETTAVLLLNLGGPDSLEAVKPFLLNLFSDREIIRLGPSFLQKPIARLISGLRSGKTRRLYSMIGGKSPILDITRAQAEALQKTLNSPQFTADGSRSFKVYVGMRYWKPFIQDSVHEILQDGLRHIIVLSLYPQYSVATTGSSVRAFKRAVGRLGIADSTVQIQYIEEWYDFPPYIHAVSDLLYKGIASFQEEKMDILFSAHNLPEHFIRDGDPYVQQTKSTVKEIMKCLSGEPYAITDIRSHLSFQSKSGPVPWMKPTTDEKILQLAQEGVKNLLVVPVSFVSDHIETLYEIDILYHHLAERHGITLKRCESLNTSEKFITALKELILQELSTPEDTR